MSSANSYLSSTAYHASNARYASSSSTSSPSASSFNIRSTTIQQPLNDLNSTRSSTSSCSTSHCLSNQCVECTTILSTRPPASSRGPLNNYVDQSSNESQFVQTCSYRSHTTCDHQHSQVSTNDDPTSTRNLSMNIPVDNSNHDRNEHSFPTASALNIELEEEDDEDADGGDGIEREQTVQNEQLEVFVGFYRPGEYQRETLEDDDDDHEADTSETSQKSDPQKKQEQSARELISDDDDEGNEDQDFIEEDFGPNQDEENDPPATQQEEDPATPADSDDNEIINGEQFLLINANILEHDQQRMHLDPPDAFPLLLVQIDEDEDQGFGAQFNDDCVSSDDENNHLSTLSLDQPAHELNYSKKTRHRRSQSDSQLHEQCYSTFLSLPTLSIRSRRSFSKVEHIIIDDQQPPTTTTMSNLMIKKKSADDLDCSSFLLKKKKRIPRDSSEEILEISNHDASSQLVVDDAVRDVERHVMLWSDDHARQTDNQSVIQQLVQYFQLNTEISEHPHLHRPSTQRELLLDYLQYRSEADISATDLHEHLLQYTEFGSLIHVRFFPFWPPRDVDLLQWLSSWIKQNALPIAIMNMDHCHSMRTALPHTANTSWQHRIIYGVEPRGIYLMNPTQIQSPQKLYERLTVDSITHVARQEIVQRYNQSPILLTPLGLPPNQSRLFTDTRWRRMNVLGQVVNVLREDRQSDENETRNIPYRPTVTHVRIPSTCASGILILSKDFHQLNNASDLPLRQ